MIWRKPTANRPPPALKILLTFGYPRRVLADQRGLTDDIALVEKPYRPKDLADCLSMMLQEEHG